MVRPGEQQPRKPLKARTETCVCSKLRACLQGREGMALGGTLLMSAKEWGLRWREQSRQGDFQLSRSYLGVVLDSPATSLH